MGQDWHASKTSRLPSESKQPTTIGSPVWVSQSPPSFMYVVVEFSTAETSGGVQSSHVHCTICEDVTVQLFTSFDENTPLSTRHGEPKAKSRSPR